MWLGQYLRTHGGLVCLFAALSILLIWVLGGPRPAPHAGAPSTAARRQAAPKRTAMRADQVVAQCRAQDIPVAPPPRPRPEDVKHPGFPTPKVAPKTLGPATRGVLGLRTRLAAVTQKLPRHAPLFHQAARGFAQRFQFFAHLSQDGAKAEAWFGALIRRRTESGEAMATASGQPATTPTTADLEKRAQNDRRIALGFYQELAENPRLRPYADLPAALLEYAELLLSAMPTSAAPPPRPGATRPAPTPAPRSLKLQLLAPYTQSRTEPERALAALSQLVQEHPKSPEAAEAAAYLITTCGGEERCRKLLALLKDLPATSPSGTEGDRRDWLRRYAQLQAAQCYLSEDRADLAVPRLRAVLAPEGRPAADIAPQFAILKREAALLLGSTVPDDASPEEAHRKLALADPDRSRLATGLLVSRWLAAGRLRAAAALCEPPDGAATRAAPRRGMTP